MNIKVDVVEKKKMMMMKDEREMIELDKGRGKKKFYKRIAKALLAK